MPMKSSKKRHGANTPRRKRTNKENRLHLAAKWLPSYTGENIVRRYAKWFGVSKLCAALELLQLGIEIPPQKIDELRLAERRLGQIRASKRLQRTLENAHNWDDWDSEWILGQQMEQVFATKHVPRKRPLVYQRRAPNRTLRRAMRCEELPF